MLKDIWASSVCWHMLDFTTRAFLANSELDTTLDNLGEAADGSRE